MPQNKKIGPLRIIAVNLLIIVVIMLCLEGAARVFLHFTRGRSTIGIQESISYLNYRAFVMYGPNWQEILDPAKYTETKKSKKVYRVLLLGGSVAAGYPQRLLEQALAKKFPGRNFEVINASCGGYTARQEVIIASIWGVPLKPDMIISLDGHNDLLDKSETPQIGTFYLDSAYELALKHPFLSPFAHILRHSQLVQGIRRLEKRIKVSPLENFVGSIPVYISAQHSLNTLAKGLSARRIMILQPLSAFKKPLSEAEANFKFYKYREPLMKKLSNMLDEELKKLSEKDNVLYGDSRFIFSGIRTTIFSDDMHFAGDEGYRILSEFIAGFVSEQDLK